MSAATRQTGIQLAAAATFALGSGEHVRAAALAQQAAEAFLAEQGEPSFDAPNLLRVRAEAELARGEPRAALRTLERAEALAGPLPPGEPFDRLRVHLARLRGTALLDAGDRKGARGALGSALALSRDALGEDDADTAAVHNLLGVVGKFTGRFDEAAEHYRRALEILGEDAHPAVLGPLHHNLGGLAHSRGDLVTAERETRSALELNSEAAGPSAFPAASDRGQLGAILSELGRHEEAERELRRTAADMTAALGRDHVEVAIARTALGAALHRAGRLEEAETAYREGLAARERAQGPEHPMLAPTLLNLSRLCEQRGDRPQARALAERAAGVLEGAVTDDHPHRTAARERLAELQV